MSTVNEYKRLQRNPILSRNQNICKTKPNLCLFAFLSLLGCACARERGRERQKEGTEERKEGRVVDVERVTSSGLLGAEARSTLGHAHTFGLLL